jgi:hypothetical protein
MSQTKILSAAQIERIKIGVRKEIDLLRTLSPQGGAIVRSEINGELRVLHGLGLIDAVEEQALVQAADRAQEQAQEAALGLEPDL